MYRELFRGSPLLVLPLIALGLFVAVYLAQTLRTLLGRRGRYDAVAALPLMDDAPPTSGPASLGQSRFPQEARP